MFDPLIAMLLVLTFGLAVAVGNGMPTVYDRDTYVVLPQIKDICGHNTLRLGSVEDGGWNICNSFEFKRTPNGKEAIRNQIKEGNGVVYSYGILDDYSFDEDCETLGLQVHGFDPSVDLEDEYSSDNKQFHKVGLGPQGKYKPGTVPFRWPGIGYLKETNKETWSLQSVTDMMADLGHSRLRILKIDAEGAEWFAMQNLMESDLISKGYLEQFVVELHFNPDQYLIVPQDNSILIYRIAPDLDVDYFQILEDFQNSGMRMWTWKWNSGDHCCIEVSFMNEHFTL